MIRVSIKLFLDMEDMMGRTFEINLEKTAIELKFAKSDDQKAKNCTV